MDVKYHYFWNIIFIVGIFDFIIYLLFFSVSLILRFKYHNNDILTKLDEYENKLLDIIFRFYLD